MKRSRKFFGFYFRSLALILGSLSLVIAISGCGGAKKVEEPAGPAMGNSQAKTSPSPVTGANKDAVKVAAASEVKDPAQKITKSDAKKQCKEKGHKGKELKNCMREMTN